MEEHAFITESALSLGELTEPQKAAIQAADNPNGENPFVTQSTLPNDELTETQKAALDAANHPSATNPLAAIADLGQGGSTIVRIVAAGQLDLSRTDILSDRIVLDELRVVDNTIGWGIAV